MRWLEPEITAQPAADVVSLDTAKAHLRVDDTESDTLISGYLAAAVGHVEAATGLALTPRTIVLRAWGFEDCTFQLPAAPVSSVTSITYLDPDGARQTLDPTAYVALLSGLTPTISRAYNQCWPAHRVQPGSVEITVSAGYAAGECPTAISQAISLVLGDWFSNRETTDPSRVQAIEMVAVDALLANFRRAYV